MKKLMLLAIFASLSLFACGPQRPSQVIAFSMTDFQFSPNRFVVPAGQEISLDAINNGAVVHNFVIMKLGETAGDLFEEDDVQKIYWEVELVPGTSIETSFSAPSEPGEYQVVCRTPGHIASGMVGTLTVVADE